jgi:aminoglycoside phosphotransferase (APT) family kinase protein
MQEQALREALEAFLRRRGGGRERVAELRELSGGASCRVYSFELHDGDEGFGATDPPPPPGSGPSASRDGSVSAPRHLVLRLDAAGPPVQGSRRDEHELLAVVAKAGVTVPAVHAFGDSSEGLGGEFFVMDLVAGQALARRLLRDPGHAETRRTLPARLGVELARLHSVDPAAEQRLAFLGQRMPAGEDPRRFALAEVERYRGILDAWAEDHPYPLLRLTGRWLARHAPPAARTALVHGDFRVGNVMFDERGLTAVLDWELAHVGDPVEDLGWFCVRAWRFGNDDLPAGGLCSREELVGFYEQAGGVRVEKASLAWWELFGNWKWAIICRMQAERARAGRVLDLELAAIGRRVAETEQEILALLDAAGSGPLREGA